LATKRNGFENGVASGSTVTVSNSDDTGASAFSVVNGGPTYDNTRAMHGTFSAKFSNATTSQPDIVGFSDTGATAFAAAGYFYLTGSPSGAVQFGIRLQTSAAAQGEKAYIDTNRKLQLVNPAGTVRVQSVGTAMPLNQWIRWEFWGTGLNSAATVLTTAFYDADTGTAIDSITTGTITTTVDVAEVRFGKNGAITIADWWLDDPASNIGSGTQLGPSAELLAVSDTITLADDDVTVTADDVVDTATLSGETATVTRSGSGPTIPPRDRARVLIDWDADGFGPDGGIDDVTDYVRGAVTCSYGRAEPTALSPVTAGSGAVSLDNTPHPVTGSRFSPRNTLSPLFGKLKSGRPFLFQRQVLGTTRTVFRGQTDRSPINPDVDESRVSLQLIDTLATMRGQKVTTSVYQGIWPGDAIGYVLDAVGWTGARDLDRGSTIFPQWWCDAADALDALQQIVASEGEPALLTVNSAGGITFRDRYHRRTDTRSTTVQATWAGQEDSVEPVMGRGYAYDDAWGSVVNTTSLTVDERAIGLQQVVWQTEDITMLQANEGRTFAVQASDPFIDAVPPREGIDYQLLNGSVENITLSRTSGQTTSITITASEDGAMLQGLALTAKPLAVARSYRIEETANDAGVSVATYGELGLPDAMSPVWAGRHDAKGLLQAVVRDRAQPLTRLRVRFVCGITDTDRLSAVLSYDLSDRIRVVEPVTAVAADFFIEQISHTMNYAGDHEVVFGLEAVPPAQPAPFLLDSSVLGTGVLTL
jgi:hypothetical protein